jgi:hypothetical protein
MAFRLVVDTNEKREVPSPVPVGELAKFSPGWELTPKHS